MKRERKISIQLVHLAKLNCFIMLINFFGIHRGKKLRNFVVYICNDSFILKHKDKICSSLSHVFKMSRPLFQLKSGGYILILLGMKLCSCNATSDYTFLPINQPLYWKLGSQNCDYLITGCRCSLLFLKRDIFDHSVVSVGLEWKAQTAQFQQGCPNTEP